MCLSRKWTAPGWTPSPQPSGMLAFASAYRYSTVEDMLDLARERGEAPF